MPDLRSMSLDELSTFLLQLGAPRYRVDQVYRWVHQRGVTSIDSMTDLPRDFRERLAEVATLTTLAVDAEQKSSDGTRKLRLRTADGNLIETVLIPDGDKLTQCISSQVGCAIDCQFCATAKIGLKRHLTAGEIVDQVYRGRALLERDEPGRRITNLVYMGMGEPLHNYDNLVASLRLLLSENGANMSRRRITVSTSGLVTPLEKFGAEQLGVGLAISLNATTNDTRTAIMPINKKWNIESLLGALRRYPLEKRRRITFEYVLLEGVNDSHADAERLAKLLRGFPAKVNIIPFNPHPQAAYKRPSQQAIDSFQRILRERGMPVYLRTPRGDDIDAACGQLANRAADGTELVPLRAHPRTSRAP